MYGKFFASAFTGSMMASGSDVFAVWAYIIANGAKGHVELNPRVLAAFIGSTPDRMRAAIDKLCEPDPESRSKDEDGRRLIRDGEFQYRVTNLEKYRMIVSEDDRREYNRQKKREERARKKAGAEAVKPRVNDSQRQSSVSAHAEAEEEADKEVDQEISSASHSHPSASAGDAGARKAKPARALTTKTPASSEDFDRFWQAYPKKAAKAAARKAFERAIARVSLDALLEAINTQMRSDGWIRDGGRYIPNPATWLDSERWEDEPTRVLATTNGAGVQGLIPSEIKHLRARMRGQWIGGQPLVLTPRERAFLEQAGELPVAGEVFDMPASTTPVSLPFTGETIDEEHPAAPILSFDVPTMTDSRRRA